MERRHCAGQGAGVARVGGGRWAGAGGGALLQDAVEVAAALGHVAPDAPREAYVRVGVDEDLHVEAVAEALVVQREDAWRSGCAPGVGGSVRLRSWGRVRED